MCIISKLIFYKELEHITLVASSLIRTKAADNDIINVISNRSNILTIKYKRIDASEIFQHLGSTYLYRVHRIKEELFYKFNNISFYNNPNLDKYKRDIILNGNILLMSHLIILLRFLLEAMNIIQD